MSGDYELSTLDAETDPFLYARKPIPFCWGFYYANGTKYKEFWGIGETRELQAENVTNQLIEFLETVTTKQIIYAHNGGKFDFHFLLEKKVLSDPKIINGRIVKASIGIHELRDSYSIIPVPLAAYQKDTIDYNLFEFETREENKADILHYLAMDCEYLFELVEAFVNEFGLRLTIGGTAIKTLKKIHPFEQQNDIHDARFRPYYFGGRVQCFDRGIIKGKFKVYDVNSMYPDVMANCNHPTGKDYALLYENDLNKSFYKTGIIDAYPYQPYFITFAGKSRGAFCTRQKNGLSFQNQTAEFKTTSHELKIALKYGLVDIEKVLEVYVPMETIKFDDFVHTYIQNKIDAKKEGNKTKELFSKLLLNSSYGKFGQNPENFFDYQFRYRGEPLPNRLHGWELYLDSCEIELWRKPAPKPIFYDVATAASITGAARAVLLEAITNADNPLYCDTDSLICENLNNVILDPYKLGAWDLEATGDLLCLGGKKLYALYDNGTCDKYASKGARLIPEQIKNICKGETIKWRNDAPNFKLDGQTKFIKRNVKMTNNDNLPETDYIEINVNSL